MRGRHAAELTHALGRIMRGTVGARDRRLALLRRELDTFDLGRRLAAIRTRLVAADGRLTASVTRQRHRADVQWREQVARLEALSPLAVLGRGYAVAWNADRTRVLRDAADVGPGDRVRVTLAKGEIDCDVRGRDDVH
jgi:exodeoxyribonuclease VII large subunit